MRTFIATLAICCLLSAHAYGQINTNFSGSQIGLQNFTLTDPNDPGFNATFGAPGEIAFFQNGSLYNGGNRAFAVGGNQTANIIFNVLADVTVAGRDTNNQTTGGASQTVPGGTTLGLANGSIEAFDASNNSVGLFTLGQAGFTSNTFSGPVARLEVTNAGPVGSFALLGSINAQASEVAVPEPGSAAVLALLGMGYGFRRRRS